MSKADWYGNFGYVPNKDNFDENALKKEELQKKFIQMCTIKTHGNVVEIEKKEVLRERNNINKKKSNKELSESDILRKDIKNLKKDIDKLKKDKEILKQSNYELKMLNKSKDLKVSTLNKDIAELLTKIEHLKNENKSLKESLNSNVIENLKEEMAEVKADNLRLKRNHEAIKGDLRMATKRLQNYQINRTGEYEGNIIRKYRERLKEKEAEIHGLKSKYISATATINELSFKIVRKHEKFILKKKAQLRKKIAEAEANGVLVNPEEQKEIVFGIISLNKDGELVFVDLNSKKYNISEYNNHQILGSNVGMPVRAAVNKEEGNVFIECIYYNLNESSKSKTLCRTKQMKLRKNTSIKSIVSNEFEGKKVLVIGSKHKDRYVRALKNMGAEVMWHESFSDNEARIEDKSSSADVVIVCTSHISHSVIYKLETLSDYMDNPKYQLLELDNITNVIGRVRYSIENQKDK